MDSDKTRFRPPATIVGDYRLVRELGSGGFGTVFEAVHLKTGMIYAVKRLHPHTDPERFKKEALYPAQAARLSQYVLNTHTFFDEPDGAFYLVTDFLKHGDLGVFVKTHGPLSIDTVLDIAVGIARGLAAIHENGVVHLDLKPANILMDRKDDQWIPKIADFGLARSNATQIDNQGLTAAYASPEHFDSRLDRTWASDMFSFGMVLFELLTGKKACGDSTSLFEYAAWISRAVPVVAPSSLRAELQGRTDIDEIVVDLLTFDVSRRTMTAVAAVRRLNDARSARRQPAIPSSPVPERLAPEKPAAGGTPPRPTAKSASTPLPGPPRTRGVPVVAIASLGFLLIAGAAGGVWLMSKDTKTAPPAGASSGEPPKAEEFPELLDKARAGDPAAQRSVGRIYAEGKLVPKNPTEARTWFEKAIDQDDAEARCALADLQRNGALGTANPAGIRSLYSEASSHHACGHRGLGELLIEKPSAAGEFDEGLRQLELAATMKDETADAKIRALQSNWALPPLIPGAWRPVMSQERRDELARLKTEKGFEALQPLDARLLRQLRVEFYDQTSLFELEVGRPSGDIGVVAYLRRPEGVVPVNGQAAQINQLNATAPIRIDTAQSAVAYLRFYQAGALQGANGPFRVIDEPGDLHWLPAATPATRAQTVQKLKRLRVEPSGSGGWQAEGSVSYNATLFAASFYLKPDGTISVKPEQVTPTLPIVQERFDAAGVRLAAVGRAPRTAQAAAQP